MRVSADYNSSMTRFIRVHFGGKVFVPDEPVDLPVGPLSLRVEQLGGVEPSASPNQPTLADFADWLEAQPEPEGWISRPDGAKQHDHYVYGVPKREEP